MRISFDIKKVSPFNLKYGIYHMNTLLLLQNRISSRSSYTIEATPFVKVYEAQVMELILNLIITYFVFVSNKLRYFLLYDDDKFANEISKVAQLNFTHY